MDKINEPPLSLRYFHIECEIKIFAKQLNMMLLRAQLKNFGS